MNRKAYLSAFLIIISAFSFWYFFIKKADYIIVFDVKTATGTVFMGVSEMTLAQAKQQSAKILAKKFAQSITVELNSDSGNYIYEWSFKSINDTITSVTVGITEKSHQLYNRFTTPFFNTSFKKKQLLFVKQFRDGLNRHLKKFKVKIDGVATFKPVKVAYIQIASVQQEKAQSMIFNDPTITGFLYQHHIKIKGTPFLEVLNWNQNDEKISFNYCFPVDANQPEIPDKLIKFKIIPSQKGLQATYYGNYRTSDSAWFALLDYAKRNNYQVKLNPIEHFLDNPFNGGDELTWRTKIILPFLHNAHEN